MKDIVHELLGEDDAQVIVVGGGPVGVAVAIDLAQRGIKVLVLEAHQHPQPIPKGQNLTSRTMEHFRSWHAERELRAAQPIPAEAGQGGLTAYGTLLHGRVHDWLRRDIVNRYYHADNARLPQYTTERVLRERLGQLPNARLFTGWRAICVEQDEAGTRVEAVNDETGATRRFCATWLIGCDGSRSLVRAAAGIGQSLEDHDRSMALITFRSPELDRLLERFPGKSFFNVLHPDFDGYWQFFGRVDTDASFFFHAPAPADGELSEAQLIAMLHRAAGVPFAVSITHASAWDLRFAIAEQYRAGRILIAGDAAHSHPPYGGYGINTGFEDARNLGWKLAAVLQGWGGEALLDSYDAERRPVFVSTARDFIAKSIENDRRFLRDHFSEAGSACLDQALGNRGQAAKDEVLAFEPHYSGSPIIHGGGGGPPSALGSHTMEARAGHHLPVAQFADGGCVGDAQCAGFTLLTDDPDIAQGFSEAAEKRELPLDCVIGSAASLGQRHILVRPDGYIGWAGNGATSDQCAEDILARCCPPARHPALTSL